jgi:hypothetical protein
VGASGLIIAVVVTAASAIDNAIGISLLDKVVEHTTTVTRAYVRNAPAGQKPGPEPRLRQPPRATQTKARP